LCTDPTAARSSLACPPTLSSRYIFFESARPSTTRCRVLREYSSQRRAHVLTDPSPPPLKGTPKEAIKDTTPATITADDDAELREAEDEGGAAKAATQANVKTKSHILGAVRSIGKRMAGFHGDVSVDGARKSVSTREAVCESPFPLGAG
jgi:hypothetical protein